jgi:hypothetical protein
MIFKKFLWISLFKEKFTSAKNGTLVSQWHIWLRYFTKFFRRPVAIKVSRSKVVSSFFIDDILCRHCFQGSWGHISEEGTVYYRAQISGQVRVQVQVRASPGPGFLVVLLCTVHIYWFFKSLKNILKPMQTYTQINCYDTLGLKRHIKVWLFHLPSRTDIFS